MTNQINSKRLFFASCIALIVTAISFALRARLETVFGPDGYGLTQEQIGWAFAPAFWGFTIAMFIGGPLVDYLGIKRILWAAFICHLIGITVTILARDFWPTMIAFVSENIPESGALGLSLMGGLGFLATAIVLPIMGKFMDLSGSGSETLRYMAILPAFLIIAFGLLYIKKKKKS